MLQPVASMSGHESSEHPKFEANNPAALHVGILEYIEANKIMASGLVSLWALTSAVVVPGLLIMTGVRNGPNPRRDYRNARRHDRQLCQLS
jgi:hypothetical protein